MANHLITKEYNDNLRKLEVTDPGHANTFNPLFNQLLNNGAYLKEAIESFKAGHGVIEGLVVSAQIVPDMTVKVTSGKVQMQDGTIVNSPGNNALSIDTADTVNQRVDIVYVDKNGTVGYKPGIPSATAKVPELPVDSFLLTQLYIEKNTTTISDVNIIDKRKLKETIEKLSEDLNSYKTATDAHLAEEANKLSEHETDITVHGGVLGRAKCNGKLYNLVIEGRSSLEIKNDYFTDISYTQKIKIIDDYIYATDSRLKRIKISNRDYSLPKSELVGNLSGYRNNIIENDADFIYAFIETNKTIVKINKISGLTVATSPTLANFLKLTLDGDYIFVISSDAGNNVKKFNKSNLSLVSQTTIAITMSHNYEIYSYDLFIIIIAGRDIYKLQKSTLSLVSEKLMYSGIYAYNDTAIIDGFIYGCGGDNGEDKGKMTKLNVSNYAKVASSEDISSGFRNGSQKYVQFPKLINNKLYCMCYIYISAENYINIVATLDLNDLSIINKMRVSPDISIHDGKAQFFYGLETYENSLFTGSHMTNMIYEISEYNKILGAQEVL